MSELDVLECVVHLKKLWVEGLIFPWMKIKLILGLTIH